MLGSVCSASDKQPDQQRTGKYYGREQSHLGHWLAKEMEAVVQLDKTERPQEKGREREGESVRLPSSIRSNCKGGGGRLKYKTTKALYSAADYTAVLLCCTVQVLYSPYHYTTTKTARPMYAARRDKDAQLVGLGGGFTTTLY